MKVLKTISQMGLLFWPFISLFAFFNTYIPKAKFFQFSELSIGSTEYKKMVSEARVEAFIEAFPWFLPIPLFVIAFLF